ncbi:MAG: hypothetical protein AB7R89_06185 [Dehalococcoidia bacterium]
MPNLNLTIDDIVEGDDRVIRFGVTVDPEGDTLDEAIVTLKSSKADADPGLVQKTISTSDVPGTGHIEDDGTSTGEAVVRVDLTPADMALPTPGTPVVFDVQVYTVGGYTNTPYMGEITTIQGVTDATLA